MHQDADETVPEPYGRREERVGVPWSWSVVYEASSAVLVFLTAVLVFLMAVLVFRHLGCRVYIGSVVSMSQLMTLYIIHTLSTFLLFLAAQV